MTKTRDLADLGGGFIQTGTNATQRTVEGKLQDVVSVLDFIPEAQHAEIKAGTSNYNATTAIQAAINSVSGGGVVTFPKGTYKVSSSLTVSNSNVHLELGSATISASGFTGWAGNSGTDFSGNRNRGLIRFVGTSVLTTDCSDTSLSATALSLNLVSTTGVQVGDLLYLQSDEPWYDTVKKIETHRIIKVDGLTVYLASPLYHSYNISGQTTSVEIIRPLVNCSVSGGIIEGEGRVEALSNGFGPCGVEVKGVSGFKIYDTEIRYFQNKALALDWAVQSSATNLMIIGHKDEYDLDPVETGLGTPDVDKGYSSFYAIFTGQSYGINLTGIKGRRVRHLTDGSNTHKSVISNCHSTYTWASTFRTHGGCTDFIYNGCTAAARHFGMQWGGFDVTVSGCTFYATDGAGGAYGMTDDIGQASDPQKTIRLLNNTIQGGVRAIYLRSNCKGLIQGNTLISNGSGTSGLIQLQSTTFDGLTIKDNIFEDPSGTRGIQVMTTGGTDGDHLSIVGNTFNYTGTDAAVSIQSNQLTNKQLNVVVSNNTLPSGVTEAVVYNSRTGGLYRVVDNFAGSTILDRELPEMKVGTWTATLTGSTGDPTGGAPTNANCRYVRIGNLVWVNGIFTGANISGATGDVVINGLPYAAWGTTGRTTCAVNFGGSGYTTPIQDILGRVNNGGSSVEIMVNRDSTTIDQLSVSSIATPTNLYVNFGLVYSTDDPF